MNLRAYAAVISILSVLPCVGQTTPRPLSDTDVESMVRAGLAPEVIVAKIRSVHCNFDTSVNALEDLQSAGVPQSVMLAMVNAEDRGRAGDSTLQPPAPIGLVIQEGTPIKLRLDETISSASVHVHDDVAFVVADPVTVRGKIVVPVGASAIGRITSVQPKRRFGRSGKLTVSIDWVRDIYGGKVPLRATQDGSSGGRMVLMTGAMLATGAVFLPAAPLLLFMRGKDSVIPQGTVLTAFVNRDTAIQARTSPVKHGAGETEP